MSRRKLDDVIAKYAEEADEKEESTEPKSKRLRKNR
jgi:hypothetical protein